MPRNAPITAIEVTGSDYRLLQDILLALTEYSEVTIDGNIYRDSNGETIMRVIHGIYLVRPSLARVLKKIRKSERG